MHLTGKTYGKRPSDLLGLKTEWGRWQFDELCAIVGAWVDENIAQGKPAFDGFETPLATDAKQNYSAMPQRGAVKKMKIPESGVW